MKIIILLGAELLFVCGVYAQSVGIGTANPDSSAQLDVISTTKGMLIPRMTNLQRIGIIKPATGLIVYQTSSPSGYYYNTGTPDVPEWVLLVNNMSAVTNVSATSPLSVTPGTTPTISLPGTAGGILYGTGSASAFSAAGSAGQFLRSNESSSPTWSTLGQSGATVFGTTSAIVFTTTFTLVPNLTQTFSVPTNAMIYVSTTGGVLTNGTLATSYTIVDVVLYLDGIEVPDGGSRRLYAVNSSNTNTVIENWSMSMLLNMTAGTHTLSVQSRREGGNVAAIVSGDTNSVLQGALTVIILKL